MKKNIITISREYGSGGRAIGEAVAKELGFSYYDRKLIDEVAKETGLDAEYIKSSAELAPKKGIFAYSFVGRDITGRSIEDIVHEAQQKVILDIVEQGPCVIVGRNADYILKDWDDVLNVYIHGVMDDKVKRICEIYKLSEDEARKQIHEVDKRRATNYHFYTEKIWGMSQNYDLCLNSSQLGYERCIKLIQECI